MPNSRSHRPDISPDRPLLRACSAVIVLLATLVGAPATPVEATSSARAVRVVVLGDSVPAGAACHCTPFGERVAAAIGARQHRPVSTQNFAWADDSAATLARLRTQRVRDAVAGSELVVVQVGANNFSRERAGFCRNRIDACYGARLRAMRTDVTRILRTVSALRRDARAQVVVVGYWNVFPDGAPGRARGRAWMLGADRLTRQVDAKLRDSARASGALYVDGYSPFKGDGSRRPDGLLAHDGDHPNAAGHRVLARAVLDRLGSRVATL